MDLTKGGTVSPADPTVNRHRLNAVDVEVTASGAVKMTLDLKIAFPDNYAGGANNIYVSGPSMPLTLAFCDEGKTRISKEKKKKLYQPSTREISPIATPPACPYAEAMMEGNTNNIIGFTIYANKDGNVAVTVMPDTGNDKDKPRTFLITFEDKPFILAWSAGFSFLGARDQQYRIDQAASAGGSGSQASTNTFHRVSDGGIPSLLAAFAHYTFVTPSWLSISAGLGTDSPSSNLSVMVGVSVSAATIPVINTGYLSIGVAYAQHKVLGAQYQGVTSIASSVTADSLTEERSTVTFFVGLSFGFWNGQDKFDAVYSGNSSSSGSQKNNS